MAYLNKAMLIGNLGKDPEIRIGQQTGRKQVRMVLATSRRYKDNKGEQKEQTDWHNLVGWGKVADIIEQLNIKKGTMMYVEGPITNRSWQDPQGQMKYMTEIQVDTFQLLSQKDQQTGPGYVQPGQGNLHSTNNPYSKPAGQASSKTQQSFGGQDYDERDDGLPF